VLSVSLQQLSLLFSDSETAKSNLFSFCK